MIDQDETTVDQPPALVPLEQAPPFEARLLRIPEDDYHERDGLSQSVATTLVARSPLHAWSQHPKHGARGKKPTKLMDRGTVVHALSLGAGKAYSVLDYPDFRTKAAQAARDDARDGGCVPILKEDFEAATVIAAKVVEQLAGHGIRLDGESEVAIEWYESTEHGHLLCRGLFDHLKLDARLILDLKITTAADMMSVEKSAERFGYAIQAAAYTRALALLEPELAGRIDFLFAFCEPEEPYAMNLCRGDGMFRALGERRWLRAVHTWGECLKANRWPGYGTGVSCLSPPIWALRQEEMAQ